MCLFILQLGIFMSIKSYDVTYCESSATNIYCPKVLDCIKHPFNTEFLSSQNDSQRTTAYHSSVYQHFHHCQSKRTPQGGSKLTLMPYSKSTLSSDQCELANARNTKPRHYQYRQHHQRQQMDQSAIHLGQKWSRSC